MILLNSFFYMNHMFCLFVGIASAILTNIKNVCFPKEKHGTVNEKNTRSGDFCVDHITNFAVITNVVIKRVHCIYVTT